MVSIFCVPIGLVAYSAVAFNNEVESLRKRLADSFAGTQFPGMADSATDSISFDWGCPVLFIGAGLVVLAALVPASRR